MLGNGEYYPALCLGARPTLESAIPDTTAMGSPLRCTTETNTDCMHA